MAIISTTVAAVLEEVVIRLLPGLTTRHRWLKASPNLQPGTLVLLKEDNTTPVHLPTAMVTSIHPGQDGIVRIVTIRTPKGVFKRPVSKMCPLPRASEI